MSTWRTWRAMRGDRYVPPPHPAVNAAPCACLKGTHAEHSLASTPGEGGWDEDDEEDGRVARDRDRPRPPRRRDGARGEPVPDGLPGRQAELPRDGGRRFLDRPEHLSRPLDSDRPAGVP